MQDKKLAQRRYIKKLSPIIIIPCGELIQI